MGALLIPLTVTCPGAYKMDINAKCDITPKEWFWQ